MAIRIAVVGMGCRGRDWIREVNAAPAYALAGCIDVDEGALKRAGVSSAQCFTRLDDVLDSGKCDAVIIATPADTHAETCEAALKRKLPVLIEKPFMLQLSDAARLVSLAESNNTPLMVAQNYRYLRSFRNVKRLIDEGALGKVAMVVCHYYRPFHQMAASLAKLSHSVLWGVSVHHLDALRYVLGTEVTNVVADSFTSPWGKLPQGASLQLDRKSVV